MDILQGCKCIFALKEPENNHFETPKKHVLLKTWEQMNLLVQYILITQIFDALRDLILFAKFKRREKHPWVSATFSKIARFRLQFY